KRSGEATMIALLQHLREAHAIQTPAPTPRNNMDLLEQEYGVFLTQERALMQSTVNLYLRITRRFVSDQFQGRKLRLNKLVAKDVIDFVLHDTPQRGRWAAKALITALRSFLGSCSPKKPERSECSNKRKAHVLNAELWGAFVEANSLAALPSPLFLDTSKCSLFHV